MLQVFDLVTEEKKEFPIIQSKLLSLEGMSQICQPQNNKIYLCGSVDTNEEFSSSFLYSIDIITTQIQIEVNSSHYHYYPTLTFLRNDFLIAIGGLNSKKCEHYSIGNKRWKDLPDLPEERYGASAVTDNSINVIYVFGGFDHQRNKNCVSIFKLNINICVKWDTIVVVGDCNMLAKSQTCITKKGDGRVWIFGGESTEIVEIDLKAKVIKPTIKKVSLMQEGVFKSLRVGVESAAGFAYAFDEGDDELCLVHKFDDAFANIVYFDDRRTSTKASVRNSPRI